MAKLEKKEKLENISKQNDKTDKFVPTFQISDFSFTLQFVGISKPYFDESFQLMYEKFASWRPAVELTKQSKTEQALHLRNSHAAMTDVEIALQTLRDLKFDDHADRELYNEALDIFSKNYASHYGKELEKKNGYISGPQQRLQRNASEKLSESR